MSYIYLVIPYIYSNSVNCRRSAIFKYSELFLVFRKTKKRLIYLKISYIYFDGNEFILTPAKIKEMHFKVTILLKKLK